MPRAGQSLTLDSIVELLSSALGREQSRELVGRTAARLGIPPGELQLRQALSIVDDLSGEPGIIGVSARMARARIVHRDAADAPASVTPALKKRAAPPAASGPLERAAAPTWSLAEVAGILSASLGQERAVEVTEVAARHLNLQVPLGQPELSALLEHLGQQGDVVGVVARFAKSRLVLPNARLKPR